MLCRSLVILVAYEEELEAELLNLEGVKHQGHLNATELPGSRSAALLPLLLLMQENVPSKITNHRGACVPQSRGGWLRAVRCCCVIPGRQVILPEGNAAPELGSCTTKPPTSHLS